MEDHDADFQALTQMEHHESLFATEEQDEWKPLFEFYGLATEQRPPPGEVNVERAAARQQQGQEFHRRARATVRRHLAERAAARSGGRLHALRRPSTKGNETWSPAR